MLPLAKGQYFILSESEHSMEKLTITTCPLCGSEALRPFMTCTDHYASDEAFGLCRCGDCGFILTQDVPAAGEIGRYYEAPDYISHTDTRKGFMNAVYHRVRSYMLGRKARLVEKESRRKSGRLLDIGAGTGYFAHAMSRRGWQVTAVEKSGQARDFARTHFALDPKPETVLPTLPTGGFDVITLWHVMEHLEDLPAVWQLLHRLLADGGTLIVAVPNCDSYDARRYGDRWAAYDVPRHLWHFTPATLRQFAERYGFGLTACHPMPFDAFYVSMLSERQQGRSMPFLRGLCAGTSAAFKAWGDKRLSSSLIYVLHKKRPIAQ